MPSSLHPPWLDASATHGTTGPVTVELVCPRLGGLAAADPGTAGRAGTSLLREREPAAPWRPGLRECLTAVPAVIVGAVTHVVWDTFTHAHRWGTEDVPALSALAAGLPVYTWLQYGSDAAGLAAVLLWSLLVLRRATPRPTPVPDGTSRDRRAVCWLTGVLVLAAGTLLVWTVEAHRQGTWWDTRIVVAVVTQDITLLGALVVGYPTGHTGWNLWRTRWRPQRLPDRTRPG